jgi:hypothetical protein
LVAGAFVILLIAAGYAGFIDFSKDVNEGNQSLAAGWFLPLTFAAASFGLATYKTFTGRLFAGQRWGRIDRELSAMGFRDATERVTEDTARLHVQLLAPGVLAVDRGSGIDHVAIGCIGGREVRSFRARIRGGRRWIDVAVVAIRLPASFAPTMIRPSKWGVPPRRGMKRVIFEHERFNRSVEVHSSDRFFATALADARMMEWLRRNLGRTAIELADGWVVAYSPSLYGTPKSPQQLIDLLVRFDGRIPRPIPSLFPRSALRTEWVHKRRHVAFSAWLDRLSSEPDESTR